MANTSTVSFNTSFRSSVLHVIYSSHIIFLFRVFYRILGLKSYLWLHRQDLKLRYHCQDGNLSAVFLLKYKFLPATLLGYFRWSAGKMPLVVSVGGHSFRTSQKKTVFCLFFSCLKLIKLTLTINVHYH